MTQAKLHTVIIDTENLEELAAFYQEGLNLGEAQPSPDHLGFEMPNVYFGFDYKERPDTERSAVSLWFAVDDLQASFDKFVSLGAKVWYPPTQKPWGARLAAVFDPEGNIIGLTAKE